MLRRQLNKVAVASVVTAAVVAGTAAWSYAQVQVLRTEAGIVTELESGLNDLQFLATEYLTTRTPRSLKQWQTRHGRLGSLLDDVAVTDDEVKRLLPEIRTRHESLGAVFSKLIRLGSLTLTPERAQAAERAAVTRLLNEVLALSQLSNRLSEIYQAREQRLFETVPMALAVTLVIGILVMATLYVMFIRRLSLNVQSLSHIIAGLGEGRLNNPFERIGDRDFDLLIASLETTRQRLGRAVAALENERADLDHFVYVASHDFKAPLRGIEHLASWIEEDAGDVLNEESREHLRLLRRRVERLETLLDDLLAYSRAGRQKVESETVDVGALVRAVVDDLSLPPEVEVVVGDLPTIRTPKTPLAHVFFNLISNAAKHRDGNRVRIEVAGEAIDGCYRFSVSDDGPGIPERYRDKIFEMFQTLRPRDQVEGSGMGLAITKRLVRAYNGEITVTGGDGRGCTFEFTWDPDETTHE